MEYQLKRFITQNSEFRVKLFPSKENALVNK